MHVELHLVHYKNESTKGEMRLPLSNKLVTMLVHLEQGRASIFHDSMALFCKKRGGPYQSGYFSTHVGDALTFDGVRLGARGMRHFFATIWRDFIHTSCMHLLEHTIKELEAHASDLMQNTPASWDVAYDEALIVRGAQHSIALWPKFEEFVHAQHMLASSRREVNPLTLRL